MESLLYKETSNPKTVVHFAREPWMKKAYKVVVWQNAMNCFLTEVIGIDDPENMADFLKKNGEEVDLYAFGFTPTGRKEGRYLRQALHDILQSIFVYFLKKTL